HPMTMALVVALAVSALLVVAVFAAWGSGRSAPAKRVLGTSVAMRDVPTPTPRAIRPAAAAAPTEAAASDVAPTKPAKRRAAPTPTPAPTAEPPTAAPTAAPHPTFTIILPTIEPMAEPTVAPATATPAGNALAAFADANALGTLAAGNWQLNDGQLVYVGQGGIAEQWLAVSGVQPTGDFAIEIEARVQSLAPNVCDQNFGAVAGADANGLVWGGGVIYPCDGSSPRARLTDVTNWADGYNHDQALAATDFKPGNSWHTYRLEVRGGTLTLSVDGRKLLDSPGARTDWQAGVPGQVGFWSQGVQLAIRSVTVYGLSEGRG
ncbi:MAG TPA: family 16 glycoside hydrolase, partial [Thermomicrobiales bacterium]|nr:family 16 glycoside hydrolase [Thermomicrobiales bacterium]